MKQNTLLYYMFLIVFGIVSCNEENCHDINYENQYLEPISLAFESFDNATTLVYKDIEGNEHLYELFPDVELLRNNVYQDSCEGEIITIQHKSEYYLRRFSSLNNTAIAVALTAGFLDSEQTYSEDRLVDILKLSVFNDNMPPEPTSRICIITSSRQGMLDKYTYNSNQYIEHDTLVLLNKTFYNVFEQKQGGIKMFYTAVDGMVSFSDNSGTQLVLDRVE